MIKIHVISNKKFSRDGLDLSTEVFIPLSDCILGCKTRVDTLDKSVDLKIPPRTQNGQKIRKNAPRESGSHPTPGFRHGFCAFWHGDDWQYHCESPSSASGQDSVQAGPNQRTGMGYRGPTLKSHPQGDHPQLVDVTQDRYNP